MRLRSPRPRSRNYSLSENWLPGWSSKGHATDGAALHFEAIDLSARGGRTQMISILAHGALLGTAILLLNLAPDLARHQAGKEGSRWAPPLFTSAAAILDAIRRPSLGKLGNGGEKDLRPPTKGQLAPSSSRPLLPPRMPQNRMVVLPAPPAVFDANAPAEVENVKHLGLPWMKLEDDSAGIGHHGIGLGPDGSMGDQPGNGAGRGDQPYAYANVASMPACQYCPSPAYTEQARKEKIQGRVTVEVLVGADGRAKSVRVVKGLGLGLDENTVQTLGTWRFVPAKNPQHQAIAVWVTIESAFRLF